MEEARMEQQRNLLFDSCRIPGFDLESKIDLLGIPTQIIPKMKAGTFLQFKSFRKLVRKTPDHMSSHDSILIRS